MTVDQVAQHYYALALENKWKRSLTPIMTMP